MLKSKFLDIVKTFSPDELKGFRNFVRSPFHNTNKNVMKITDIIRENYPDLNNDKLVKEKIFSRIYPGKKYNDTVMRILLSDLLKLAEEYLTYLNFVRHPIKEKMFLLHELDERKLYVLFNRHLNSSREILNENKARENSIDIDYFLNLFEIESIKVNNLISRNKQNESGENVLKQSEYLINFFLINILNIAQELSVHEDLLNVKFNFNVSYEFLNNFNIKKFIDYLEKGNYKYYSVLSIYYYMYLASISPGDVEIYFKLKDLVFNNLNLFNREEKFNLFIILESICTTNISSGKRNFHEEVMILYQEMVSKNIYTISDKDYFQLNLFRNMFYTAIVLGKFEWAESFIKNYFQKLSPEYRDEAFHLGYALIYFGKKEYEKALTEISKVKYNFFVFKYDVRLLTLKTFYEMNAFESALSLIDTFTHFLSNNKSASETYKEGFYNFLKFVNQLIKIKTGNKKIDREEIRNKLLQTDRVINKNWILEKLDEM